ncbi:hyaluronan and proteoglycan link protein 1-like [Oncorhynchus masou masou]|uniref:hyaluronan and proteoglycan link protein 1-like n=1 Tax=Oncorhynchus masou masou TaxID=90313 RepID=UPI00318438EB
MRCADGTILWRVLRLWVVQLTYQAVIQTDRDTLNFAPLESDWSDHRDVSLPTNLKLRIKWTKLTSEYLRGGDVFIAMGFHKRSYRRFHGRIYLQDSAPTDASLVITELTLEDYGRYKCEVIDRMENGTGVVSLDLQGIVYPYFPQLVRYNLNFFDAEWACSDQDSIMASFDQLYEAWHGGLDWCNAGWGSDR